MYFFVRSGLQQHRRRKAVDTSRVILDADLAIHAILWLFYSMAATYMADLDSHLWLWIAGVACLTASLLHIGIIIGGPDWYRFFGAGEGMAALAEAGHPKATYITLGIAVVLAIFAGYAFGAAGLLPQLPLSRLALVAITGVFMLRGITGFIVPFLNAHPAIPQNTLMFWMVSSVVCLTIGVSFLLGTRTVWHTL